MAEESGKIEFDVGGMDEFREWELVFDAEVHLNYICPHCIAHESNLNLLICPRVVRGFNEGGYGVTMICLDCIIEQVTKAGESSGQPS